jgi:hypothetical protein
MQQVNAAPPKATITPDRTYVRRCQTRGTQGGSSS